MSSQRAVVWSCAVLVTFPLLAQAPGPNPWAEYPPELAGARVETYKSIDGIDLNLWIYTPEGHSASDRRPAVVFFFGGGWRAGNPAQFAKQCEVLSARGMVAITADYRVLLRHGVPARFSVADAKSSIRWVRENADRLGIDAGRIASAGGSAGGHLAASTAFLAEHDDPADNLATSAKPDALVLFNPATVLASLEGVFDGDSVELLRWRMGAALETMSPYHNLGKGAPPTIVFHGRADTVVPYATAEIFCARMNELGGSCELVGYDGAGHGFFNYNRGTDAFGDTLRRTENFLVSLGWLPPSATATGG